VVACAAAAVTLTACSGDGADQNTAAPATTTSTTSAAESGYKYDLSSPQAAAEAFAAVAETGSGDDLLRLACIGHAACASEHAAGMSDAELTEAQNTIRDGVYELAHHLKGVEFTAPVDGTAPGTKNVPYRTPELTGDASLTLTFVESEGEWLYLQPSA
jgi:predicted flap endonuclease-1-like 5' DNA nuclease